MVEPKKLEELSRLSDMGYLSVPHTPQIISVEQAKAAFREVLAEQQKRKRSDTGTANPALGDLIKNEREERGLTRTELATMAGLHHSTPQKIEEGLRGVSLTTIAKIWDAFYDYDLEHMDTAKQATEQARQLAADILERVLEGMRK